MFKKLITSALVGIGALAVGASSVSAGTISMSNYGMNTYYGSAYGSGWVPDTGTYLVVDTMLTDKPDGHYATLQARALVTDGARTWWGPWANVTTTGSTTVPKYGSRTLRTGTGKSIVDAQVRICQTTGTGSISGSCTRPVGLDDWRVTTGY